jgi:hypothetical protein
MPDKAANNCPSLAGLDVLKFNTRTALHME